MSKLSELDAVLSELSVHSKGILEAVNGLRELLVAQIEPEAPIPKAYTLNEVRSALTVLTRNGHRDAVQELLRRHGAERLKDIAPSEYATMMQEAEAIGK